MSTFRNIDVKSPHIQELQQTIQLELAKRGYSSEDDPVMAEYIVVMLANQKTADQITSELQDLVGGEYDANFTAWVWDATQQCLDRYAPREQEGEALGSAAAAPAAGRTRNARQRRSRSPQSTRAAGRVGRDGRRSRSPTAANSRRENETRRSRSRSPPKLAWGRGPLKPRDYIDLESFRKSTSLRKEDEEEFDGATYWRQKAEERRKNPPPPVMRHGPQQIFQAAYGRALRDGTTSNAKANGDRELFPDSSDNNLDRAPPYEQASSAATGGVSIFGRAGIPDPRAPAFVPQSSSTTSPPPYSTMPNGPSILSRIDPMLPSNDPLPLPTATTTPHSSNFPTAPTETSICRWNVGCTNPMCPYSHASPANANPGGNPNALVLSQQNCRYGSTCTNKDCTRSHVSPSVAKISARTQPCTPAPAPAAPAPTPAVLSMDAALPSGMASRPCKFGASCSRVDCFFSHPPNRGAGAGAGATPCRFGLGCTRKDCYFSHPPGQRAADAQGGTSNRLQAFANENGENEEMEVIIPGQQQTREGTDGSETVVDSPRVEGGSVNT